LTFNEFNILFVFSGVVKIALAVCFVQVMMLVIVYLISQVVDLVEEGAGEGEILK
jgi:hypothetical protein